MLRFGLLHIKKVTSTDLGDRSQRHEPSDVRNVYRMLGEITELGRDHRGQRLHMLEKLLPLIGARRSSRQALHCPTDPTDTRLIGMVEFGWKPGEQELFYEHLQSGGMVRDPLHEVVPPLLFRSFTRRRRRDFITDEVWYASPVVDPLRRKCNVDDNIHTRCRLPQKG